MQHTCPRDVMSEISLGYLTHMEPVWVHESEGAAPAAAGAARSHPHAHDPPF